MNQLWQILDGTTGSYNGTFTPENVFLSLLLAFVLGQSLAWTYYFTHSGLSYSRSFVQSLVLITVMVAMIMAVIGNNIITAFGLMGALAIIRFRNVVKDTRDIVFIFCTLVVGMAAGLADTAVAAAGLAFVLASVFFAVTATLFYYLLVWPLKGAVRLAGRRIVPLRPAIKERYPTLLVHTSCGVGILDSAFWQCRSP